MGKTCFVVYMDTLATAIESLNREELGELFQAIYAYHEGRSFEFESRTTKIVFSFFVKNFEFDLVKSEKARQQRIEAINKRWHNTEKKKLPPPAKEETKPVVVEEKPKEAPQKVSKDNITEIKDMWNNICGATFGKIQTISVVRGQKIRARIKEFGDNYLCRFEEIFKRLSNAPFCIQGAKQWCTFDWIIANDNNYVKLLEGRYDHENNGQSNRPLTKFELSKLNDQQLGIAVAESCARDFENERTQDRFVPPAL